MPGAASSSTASPRRWPSTSRSTSTRTGATAPRRRPTGRRGAGARAIHDKLAERAAAPVASAVELGCGPGRGLWELARGAGLVVGLDAQLAVLRRARALVGGEPLSLRAPHRRPALRDRRSWRRSRPPRSRGAGLRRRARSAARAPELRSRGGGQPARRRRLAAAAPRRRRRAVRARRRGPLGLALRLAERHRRRRAPLRRRRSRGRLVRRFAEGDGLEARYTIEDDCDVPWTLRRDARSAVVYRVHWLRARKSR